MFSVVESSNFLVYDLSPDLSSYTSNTMGVTCGEGTAYHPGTPTIEFIPGFKHGPCYSIFTFLFLSSHGRILIVVVSLVMVLSVLQFTTSGDPSNFLLADCSQKESDDFEKKK